MWLYCWLVFELWLEDDNAVLGRYDCEIVGACPNLIIMQGHVFIDFKLRSCSRLDERSGY